MSKLLMVFCLVGLVSSDYDFMSDMIWGGPERGCDSSEGAGQAVISCTLASGNITINVDRAASWLKITCEENSSFKCSELEDARPHISYYINVDGQTDRQLSRLDVDTCILPSESLACLPGLVNASSTVLMRLIHCDGQLTDENLDGMDAVKFRMNYIDKNTTSVPYTALSKLRSLRSFTMKGGSLTLKRSDVMLPELLTLELADGGLEAIPREAFTNTPNIQTLMLWGNRISTVDEDAFKGLSNLSNISLNSNNISVLPTNLFAHSPLTRRLDLYDNRLVLLQRDLFRGLQHLEEVIITSNKANLTLEETFSNLPSLTHLKLETSNLRQLPDTVLRNSTSLTTLSLAGNRLENLPPSVFKDQKLTVLRLHDNRISQLPASLLESQTELEVLDLRRNTLKRLPGGLLSKARSLKVLDLSDNRIELLESNSFNGAENLKELNLAGNRIRHLNSTTFEVILYLEVLSLARNNITISERENTIRMISPDEYYTSDELKTYQYYSTFRSLKNLKVLNLSKNNVSMVCEDWRQFVSLETIDLSHNSINFLSDVSMHFDLSNAIVDVSHNEITSLVPPEYGRGADTPTFILNHNPFACDCYLYEFVRRRASGGTLPVLRLDEAACASPPALAGAPIARVAPKSLSCDIPCAGCACKIIPYDRRFDIRCEELPGELPDVPEAFEAMALANEIHLRTRPSHVPEYYKYVDLSNMNLSTAPSVDGALEMNLTNNNLVRGPVELFERNCSLYLSGNPFLCSCEDYENVRVMKRYSHLILDYNATACSDGGPVSGVNLAQLCAARDAAVVGSAIAVFGIVLAVFTALAYKYSTEIRILLRKYDLWWGDEVDGDEEYDAFVSYSHRDESYVVDTLVPNLEGGKPPLKLCVHYRNWVIGDFIPAQIARSVDGSRKTIIVLSKHFVASAWGHMEFRTAHGRGKVVIVMLDDLAAERDLDPELKAYIAMNTYVKSSDPLVFDRIRDAVLAKTCSGLNVQLLDGQLVNVKKDVQVEMP